MSKKNVAIKIYDKFKLMDPHKFNNVKREINILGKLNNSFIIKLFHIIDDATTVKII